MLLYGRAYELDLNFEIVVRGPGTESKQGGFSISDMKPSVQATSVGQAVEVSIAKEMNALYQQHCATKAKGLVRCPSAQDYWSAIGNGRYELSLEAPIGPLGSDMVCSEPFSLDSGVSIAPPLVHDACKYMCRSSTLWMECSRSAMLSRGMPCSRHDTLHSGHASSFFMHHCSSCAILHDALHNASFFTMYRSSS